MKSDTVKLYLEYIHRTEEIRELFTPPLDDICNADDYEKRLRENFGRIGELAAMNRDFLDIVILPIISAGGPLDQETISVMSDFAEALVNSRCTESLDLPVMYSISDRLLTEAEESGDIYRKIRAMDMRMESLYGLMNMTGRLKAYPEISEHYRELGFEIGDFFLDLLQKDKFKKIEDMECCEIIVTDARYSIVFFEGISNDREMCEKQLERLKLMLEVEEDPFYREALPEFDWRYFHFRVLQYMAMAPEHNNAAGFNDDELKLISEKTKEMWLLYNENKEYFKHVLEGSEDRRSLDFLLYRARYLAGEYDEDTYLKMLEIAYEQRKNSDYSTKGGYLNLFVPEEMNFLFGEDGCTVRNQHKLQTIYHNIISYAYLMTNGESFSAHLESYAYFLDSFIEKASGISFEGMILQCLAAFHPPTYVHSLMVAQMTECLCSRLIVMKPELFIGVLDCKDVQEVSDKMDEIVRFSYHAALCHDFGKIMIIDTIFIYGRKLLDMEFDYIETHPKTGAEMLRRYASTKAYADVALGHHRWYDNSKGYPEEFDTSKSPLKTIIDIVLVADCLDAATDTVGRSYSRGKNLDEFIGELKEGAGTHYAPWMYEIMTDPTVHEDMEYLLSDGRRINYKATYYLLKGMKEREVISIKG